MKKRKKKNAITLLALVITIVIMLLLAGVAIQMTFGENGLIAKSVQAQKEQAKAELYDNAKLDYLSIKTNAISKNNPNPEVEEVLSDTNFLSKYNIVGDNITNKNGEVIDTKENLLKELEGLGTNSNSNRPKISPEDKDKLIFQINIENSADFSLEMGPNTMINAIIESYDGTSQTLEYGYGSILYESFSSGKYIYKIKFLGPDSPNEFLFYLSSSSGAASIDILNWR